VDIRPVVLAPKPIEPLSNAPLRTRLAALVVLFKLRVVALLLCAAVGGLVLGAGERVELSALVVLLLTGAMSAAGASALNQYLEREQDARMRRTRGCCWARCLARSRLLSTPE